MKHLKWLLAVVVLPVLASPKVNLSSEPEWLRLLHYQGIQSSIDHPDFFLAQNGRHDPQAEFTATLTALETPQKTGDNSVYCRFPARREFISRRLERRFPEQTCAAFKHYQRNTPFNGASFLLAAGYLHSASSVFGHTFFRIKRGQGHSQLLDPVLNYTANTEGDNDLFEIVYGLGGGYRGRFSQIAFYDRLNHHNIGEDRDIWEYPINLSQTQLLQLQRHYWEIKTLDFPYYFMSQNCLTQLLAMVNAVAPEFDILTNSSFKVTPLQTFSLLRRETSLLAKPIYHPSPSNRLRFRESLLSKQEVASVKRLIVEPSAKPNASTRALDVALELAIFRQLSSQTPLLNRRNANLDISQWPDTPTPNSQPAFAHGSWRSGVSGVYQNGQWQPRIEQRFIYHDMLDPAGANPWGTAVEILDTRLQRIDQQWKLSQVTLLNLSDLKPRTALHKPLSAITKIGFERNEAADSNTYWHMANGWSWGRHPLTAYFLPSMQLEFGKRHQRAWTLRAGLFSGLLWQPSRQWTLQLATNGSLPLLHNSQKHWQLTLEQQWSINRSWGLRWSAKQSRGAGEPSHALSLYHYW